MHEIKQRVGAVVAADTQASVAALDTALIVHSRMCASIVEAATDSNLPISAVQNLLDSLTSGICGLVASRADLAKAVHELAQIQSKSSLRETSFGCPTGPATFMYADDRSGLPAIAQAV